MQSISELKIHKFTLSNIRSCQKLFTTEVGKECNSRY
jgi:hypothetical protein